MNTKSQKELAFLQDLYIATDWGERFADLVDERVTLPKEGRALYVAAGSGGHAIALQARAGKKLQFLCVDENAEYPLANGLGYREFGRPTRPGRRHFLDGD